MTDIGHVEPEPAVFIAQERPELWVDKAYVEGVLAGENDAALVCSTPKAEFTGESATRSRSGHIPGSLSVPVGALVERDTRTRARPGCAPRPVRPGTGVPSGS